MADALITRRGGAGGKITNSKEIKCFSESSIDANTFVSLTNVKPYKEVFQGLSTDTSNWGSKLYVYSIPLDETRTIVFYKDANYYLYAVVYKRTNSGTIKGTSLQLNAYSYNSNLSSFGNYYLPNQYNTLLLSSGKIFFANSTVSGYVKNVLVLDIDNTTISVTQSTAPTAWSSTYYQMFSCSAQIAEIDSNKLLAISKTYVSGGSDASKVACILFIDSDGKVTFSETTSIGVPSSSTTVHYDGVELLELKANRFVVLLPMGSGYAYVRVLDVSLGETAETSSISFGEALQLSYYYYGMRMIKVNENTFIAAVSSRSTSSSNYYSTVILLRAQTSGNLVQLDAKEDQSVLNYDAANRYRTEIFKGESKYVFAKMHDNAVDINTFTISNDEITLGTGSRVQLYFGTSGSYYIIPYADAGLSYVSFMKFSEDKLFMIVPTKTSASNTAKGLVFVTIPVQNPKNDYTSVRAGNNPLSFLGTFAYIGEANGRYALGIATFKTYNSSQGVYNYYTENLSYDEIFNSFVENSLATNEVDGVTKGNLLPGIKGRCMILADGNTDS